MSKIEYFIIYVTCHIPITRKLKDKLSLKIHRTFQLYTKIFHPKKYRKQKLKFLDTILDIVRQA